MSADLSMQKIFNELSELLKKLCTWYDVISICVTWSYGNTLNRWFIDENAQDIDFFVVYKKGKKKNVRQWLEHIFGKENIFRCDDAYRVSLHWREASFALKEDNSFYRQVQNILHGKIKEENTLWAVGGYMSEVLIHDILSCYILFDEQWYFDWLKNTIIASWDVLIKNLSKRFLEELTYKTQYIKKDRNMCFNMVLLGDLVKQYVRLYSLQKWEVCFWLKHINDSDIFPLDDSEKEAIKKLLLKIEKCIFHSK